MYFIKNLRSSFRYTQLELIKAIEDKTEQSYEIKSLPFSKSEMNYLNSHNDEQYIVIDLAKQYAQKITDQNDQNDKVDLTFAFNPSYPLDPLLENHFLLAKISKNRLKIFDKDGLIYTVEL